MNKTNFYVALAIVVFVFIVFNVWRIEASFFRLTSDKSEASGSFVCPENGFPCFPLFPFSEMIEDFNCTSAEECMAKYFPECEIDFVQGNGRYLVDCPLW